MGKQKKPVQEQAKEELAELLELDAEVQAEEEGPKSQTDILKENQFLPITMPKDEKAANVAKSNREMYNAFTPREKRKMRHTEDGIHHNPTFLNWPTDKWGLTKDLKAALIVLASRIAGHEDKKLLVDEVLRVGLGHMEQKFALDNAARKAAQVKAE